MAIDLNKFIPRFQEESRDLIQVMIEGLMKIESGTNPVSAIDEVFRSAHKIKGNSRMLNLLGINELAHHLEDVLDSVRSQRINVNSVLIDLLMQSVDLLGSLIGKADDRSQELKADQKIIDLLKSSAIGDTKAAQEFIENPEIAKAPAASAEKDNPDNGLHHHEIAPETNTRTAEKSETVRVRSLLLDELIHTTGEIFNHQNKLQYIMTGFAKLVHDIENSRKKNKAMDNDLGKIQSLLLKTEKELKTLHKNANEEMSLLEIVSKELQESAMKLRMLPLGVIFDTLPRAVRDMARELGKMVHFQVTGQNIEIDKKIIEILGDPILHIIRNAIDHGIEKPEQRKLNQKPETASIAIHASYEGGSVTISISDDGSGINSTRVKERALSKGLIDAHKKEELSNDEIHNLIFQPGFSTAPIITDISGRGVGLDIVKSAMNSVKGNVHVKSDEGKGTTFVLKMPLSLATLTVLFVQVNTVLFGLPINYLNEIIQFEEDKMFNAAGRRAIRLRDQLVPVVNLAEVLGLTGFMQNQASCKIIITRVDNNLLGLIVDDLIGQGEFVIKPLPGHIKNNVIVSGVVITEKNELANILHIPELVSRARLVSNVQTTSQVKKGPVKKRILVVDDSINTREIEKSILETAGYLVELAFDGKDALEKSTKNEFDLIITDVDMPLMDGFTLTRALRETEIYKNKPVVIVTSREKEEDKRKGIEVGASAYIVKGGFDQGSLLSVIESLI